MIQVLDEGWVETKSGIAGYTFNKRKILSGDHEVIEKCDDNISHWNNKLEKYIYMLEKNHCSSSSSFFSVCTFIFSFSFSSSL